jgi:hypothetical protein
MNTVTEIIEAARQRILVHRIRCSVDLLEYLRFLNLHL